MEADPLVGLLRSRRAFLAAALVATGLALAGAWAIKSPCLTLPWDGSQYAHGCYNDIVPLYGSRGFDQDRIPYVESFDEYPVLIGLEQWAAAALSDGMAGFFAWTALFSSLFALGTTLLVADLTQPRRRVFLWALGPPLALYAFHNWDLLAVFLTTLGLWAFRRDRALLCGMALGLGAAAKLYPALLLPVFGMAYLRREGRLGRAGWAFGLGAVGAWAAVNLPFLLLNPDLWAETYRFHAARGPTYESLWYILAELERRMGAAGAADFFFSEAWTRVLQVGVAAAVGGLAYGVWRGRFSPERAALAALCAFIVLNPFMSVQYLIWLLPFTAILAVPGPRIAFLWLGDVLVYVFLFAYFYSFDHGFGDHAFTALTAAVLLRAVALLVLLLTAVLPDRPAPAAPHPAPP